MRQNDSLCIMRCWQNVNRNYLLYINLRHNNNINNKSRRINYIELIKLFINNVCIGVHRYTIIIIHGVVVITVLMDFLNALCSCTT